MPTPGAEEFEELIRLFAVLSDKTRLGILLALSDGEANVGALCLKLKLPQPSVSHHLGILRDNGVVRPRRSGKQVFYSVCDGLPSKVGLYAINLQKIGPLTTERAKSAGEWA